MKIKLLRLIGSDNENEALESLRQLKKLLAKDNESWNAFIDSFGSSEESQSQNHSNDYDFTTTYSSAFDSLVRQKQKEKAEREKDLGQGIKVKPGRGDL